MTTFTITVAGAPLITIEATFRTERALKKEKPEEPEKIRSTMLERTGDPMIEMTVMIKEGGIMIPERGNLKKVDKGFMKSRTLANAQRLVSSPHQTCLLSQTQWRSFLLPLLFRRPIFT